MIGKIFPVLLALVGLTAGGGAGYFLRPPPPDPKTMAECAPVPQDHAESDAENTEEITATSEFVKRNNQFIVPVVEDGLVSSLVILSLSLEVKTGATEKVYRAEPKLRDAFLQVLFDHANTGGFAGAFTGSGNMDRLRTSLTETARTVLGSEVIGVLVSHIVRQDT
jgi:hypothetical protein